MDKKELDNLLKQFGTADIFPVVNRYPADLITPLGAYLAISESTTHSFLFESVEGGETLARYSFIGSDPESVLKETPQTTVFEALRTKLTGLKLADVENLPSFTGGAVGCFDFADVEHFEPGLRTHGARFEHASQSVFMFFRTILAFDHARQELMVISLVVKDRDAGPEELKTKCLEACSENRRLAEKLSRAVFGDAADEVAATPHKPESNFTKAEFIDSVKQIKELIAAGDVYQVVLSQCFTKKTSAGAVPIYRALRSLNPSPYMFLVVTGDRAVVGASPEMLVRSRGRKVEYRAIAGTRPRSGVEDEDRRLAEEMKNDEKERAEHTMLVDLGRNDLGRVARFGSVRVKELMSVEKFSHVQHLVSYLSAELEEGKSGFDAFAACFPAGTVSGAPKIKAIETIYGLEPAARGVYAGAIGYFDFAGNLDTCISIRTLVLEGGSAKIQTGAGIVADSIPESEWEETLIKAAGLFRAIELAESGIYGI